MSNLFNPSHPISSFLSLPTKKLNSGAKKSTNKDRRNIYGTQWISEGQRSRSEIRKNKKRDSFSRPTTASSSGVNLELKRLQHDQNRLTSNYLETSKSSEINQWLKKKDSENRARKRKEKENEKSKQKENSKEKLTKLEKSAESKILFKLWTDWKSDSEGRNLKFSDYKEMREKAKENVESKEIPVFKTSSILKQTSDASLVTETDPSKTKTFAHNNFIVDDLNESTSSQKTVSFLDQKQVQKLDFVVTGDPGVGKSAILRYFVHGVFVEEAKSNVFFGSSNNRVLKKTVEFGDSNVILTLHDLVTIEQSNAVKNTDAVFLVYDCARRESLRTVEIYLDKAKRLVKESWLIYVMYI